MRNFKFAVPFVAGMLLATASFAAESFTAKYNMYAPPKHPISKDAILPFIDSVEKATAGSVKIVPYFGGALFGATETLDGVKGGGAELGFITMGVHPAELRHGVLLSDLAMVGSKPFAVAAASSELFLLHCSPCQEEFKAQNIVYLGGLTTNVYSLISKEPFEALADLKGKKIRTAGSVWDRWLKSVGAVPVNIPTSEMFDGLSRGVLDGVIAAESAARSQSLWDVAKYLQTGPFGTYPATMLAAANMDFYGKLDREQRMALLNAGAQGIFDATAGYIAADVEVVGAAAEHGLKISPLGKEVAASFESFNKNDLEQLAGSAKERLGIADADAFIAKYRELYAKWDRMLTDANALQDKDRAAALFKAEVTSKLDPESYGLRK